MNFNFFGIPIHVCMDEIRMACPVIALAITTCVCWCHKIFKRNK